MPRALSSILALQSDAEIEKIVVLDVVSGLVVPPIGEALVGVRLVDVGCFAREALAARVDAVADQARALADALGVVDRFLVVHAAALHTEYRPAAVETHVQGDTPVLAGVGEGAVQRPGGGGGGIARRRKKR